MKKSQLKITKSKEKELALSLLRIPINFFAKDDVTTSKNEKSGSNSLNINANESTSKRIEIDANKAQPITINLEMDVKTSEKAPSATKSTSNSSHGSTASSPQPNEEKKQESDHSEPTSQKENTDSKSNPSTAPQSQSNPVNPVQKAPSPPDQPQQTNTAEEKNSEHKKASSPGSAQKNDSSSDHKPVSEKESAAPDSSKEAALIDNSNNQNEEKRSEDKKAESKDKKTNKKSDNPKDSEKQKKADDLRKKYNLGNTKPGKKLKGATDNAKKKMADKIAKNPAASKALSGLNQAQDIKQKTDNLKDAVNNMDTDKLQEAVGDAAVQVASKTGDAILPGLGKAIGVADKLVGQTQAGKSAKKAIGGCGCIVVLMTILLPIVILISSFSWIVNLFGNNTAYIENLEADDRKKLIEASEKYSMSGCLNLAIELSNPSGWEQIWGQTAKGSIENAVNTYVEDFSRFSEDDANKYNSDNAKFIENGYLPGVTAGELTSFGLAFESIKSNYTIQRLKAHASAPQYEKEVDGKKVIYTTYDPTGIHHPLFESVLKNPEDLEKLFSENVSHDFFENLTNILDTKFDVYVEGIDEPNTTKKRSLRDLFEETSIQANDATYDVNIVNTTLTKHTDINKEIIDQYNDWDNDKDDNLVTELAKLELMTYIQSHISYYQQIQDFYKTIDNCINKKMFNDNFFAQFLTFAKVDYFLALSSLTDNSLAYEIAVASIKASDSSFSSNIEIKNGKSFAKLYEYKNWFATYKFKPTLELSGDNYLYTSAQTECIPTAEQQRLFTKYNIKDDEYDAFFSLFETATGIKIEKVSSEDEHAPFAYLIDETGELSRKVGWFYEDYPPSFSFGATYKPETVKEFNLSDNIHDGVDYSMPVGTPIRSASSGTARIHRSNEGYGNYIEIIDKDPSSPYYGYTAIYAHGNGTFRVDDGAEVAKGTIIMESGDSGNSTGPHLHFEVRDPSGTRINPNIFMN